MLSSSFAMVLYRFYTTVQARRQKKGEYAPIGSWTGIEKGRSAKQAHVLLSTSAFDSIGLQPPAERCPPHPLAYLPEIKRM
jgi:hypothetical protein